MEARSRMKPHEAALASPDGVRKRLEKDSNGLKLKSMAKTQRFSREIWFRYSEVPENCSLCSLRSTKMLWLEIFGFLEQNSISWLSGVMF